MTSRRLPTSPDLLSPMNENPPECPDCGGPMVLRTARKGRNAGGQFWGCSGYPRCKGLRPLVEGGSDNAPTASRGSEAPVVFTARPRSRDFQTAFFQVCALPERAVRGLA